LAEIGYNFFLFEELYCYFGKCYEMKFFAKFGEEDISVFAKDAGHKAKLIGFFENDETALDIIGGNYGLLFL
jgi:hypothetical protein